MNTEITTTTVCFLLARAVHYGSCMLILGTWTFDRTVITSVIRQQASALTDLWQRIAAWLLLLALPAALISGAAWFWLVAVNISGLPAADAIHLPVLKLIWLHTHFGAVWKWRLIFWLVSVLNAAVILPGPASARFKSILSWLAIVFGSLLLAGLAWAGHAELGEWRRWHLLPDALHLLISSLWPMGLVPFALLLILQGRSSDLDGRAALPRIVNRFSTISFASVAMLTATGLINSYYMLRSISDLLFSPYGRLLMLKIILFCFMMGLGALNILYFRPRINRCTDQLSHHVGQLKISVCIEILFGVFIILVVASLGMIAPPHG